MKKHLSLIAFVFFISTIMLFDSAFAAVSEGCEIFEIKAFGGFGSSFYLTKTCRH